MGLCPKLTRKHGLLLRWRAIIQDHAGEAPFNRKYFLLAHIFSSWQVTSSLLHFPAEIIPHIGIIYSTYYYPELTASLVALPFLLHLLPRVSHAT